MRKKGISVLLITCIIVLTPVFCFAEDTEEQEYEPYTVMEFSSFAMDMRRAETIFFGSLPLTYMISSLAIGAVDALVSTDLPNAEIGLGVTLGFSLTIAIIDYVLGLDEENQVE